MLMLAHDIIEGKSKNKIYIKAKKTVKFIKICN